MLSSEAPLHACRVAAARFGGPIAMIRDDRQMVAVSGGTTQPVMRVYTAAGTLLSAFVWDKGPIVAMDWTDSEDLMVVQPDGQVGDCTAPTTCLGGSAGTAAAGGINAVTVALTLGRIARQRMCVKDRLLNTTLPSRLSSRSSTIILASPDRSYRGQ